MFPIEMAVIQAIAALQGDEVEEIISQARLARVNSRKNTGSGFYTALEVPRMTRELRKSVYPGPWVEIEGLSREVSFILYVKNGYLSELECAAGGSDTGHLDYKNAKWTILNN